MPLERLINNLKNLKVSLESNLDNTINANLSNLEQMQRDRLNKGENSEGDKLRREEGFYPYSPQYAKYKRARGGQVKFVDLKLDGDFHAGIDAKKVGKGKVTLYSKDKKEKFLSSQYKGIYGFAPNQRQELNNIFVPEIIRAARERITNLR